MRITAIYDNGGKTIDQYSVITDFDTSVHNEMRRNGDKQPLVDMLCVDNVGGSTYSNWGYGIEGDHLGKKIHFEDLNAATQQHIVDRLFTKEIVIEVSGGVAQVTQGNLGVDVEIIDRDNEKA